MVDLGVLCGFWSTIALPAIAVLVFIIYVFIYGWRRRTGWGVDNAGLIFILFLAANLMFIREYCGS